MTKLVIKHLILALYNAFFTAHPEDIYGQPGEAELHAIYDAVKEYIKATEHE